MTQTETKAKELTEQAAALDLMTKGIEDDTCWTDIGSINDLAGGNVSVAAASSQDRSLTPAQSYELSIAARKAVTVIARNLSKAKLRLFDRDGAEIIGGTAYDVLKTPAPRMTTQRWVETNVTWFNISGEWDCWAKVFRGEDYPRYIYPLNPNSLEIERPANPRSRVQVSKWRYVWTNGDNDLIPGTELVGDAMFNPNPESIRGLSPLVTGGAVVSSGHYLEKYNRSFFQNNAVPDVVVDLGEGVGRAQRQDFERRFFAEFSTYRDNAHKLFVTSGGKVNIQKLSNDSREGSFLDLDKSIIAKVAMLYGVPPIEMGIYDKTRFDTAAEERKLFVESTLMPQAEAFSLALQYQLIDPWFAASPVKRQSRSDTKMSKGMAREFDRAQAERPDSSIIVLLDVDTLPIMAQVKSAMIATAKEFRDVLLMSPMEVAEYFSLDIEEKPERKDIWILNNYNNVSNPKMMQEFAPKPAPAPAAGGDGKPGPKTQGQKAPAKPKAKVKAMEKMLRRFRKSILDHYDAGVAFPLAEADALNEEDDPDIRAAIRRLRFDVKCLLDAGEDTNHVKAMLNNGGVEGWLR